MLMYWSNRIVNSKWDGGCLQLIAFWRLSHGARMMRRIRRDWGCCFLSNDLPGTELCILPNRAHSLLLQPPALRDPCCRGQLLQDVTPQSPGHWNTSAFACAETEGSSLWWKISLSGVWGWDSALRLPAKPKCPEIMTLTQKSRDLESHRAGVSIIYVFFF